MTGIELIAKERKEQLEKHGRTIKADVDFNSVEDETYLGLYPLVAGAIGVLDKGFGRTPKHWNQVDVVEHMKSKEYKDRLVVAGALIAAEIDRLQYIENQK